MCFRKSLVSKNFMDTRGEREMEYHDFPSKVCCVTVPINFVGEPFCVPENFWYRKILWITGGREYHDFPSKLCCLTVPKTFVGIPSMFQKIWGIEKFYA